MTLSIENSNTRNGVKDVTSVIRPSLSRFLPSSDRSAPSVDLPKVVQPIDPTERQRLMESCLAECRSAGISQIVDWQEVDRINDVIRETTSKSELVANLAKYKAALCGGQPA